jgi:tRNA pseudouridine13 synthase
MGGNGHKKIREIHYRMIVKQTPEDFRVEELTDVRPEAAGPFALYRLEKTGWTTPDALAAVRRRWKIDPARLSYGGLKDRHARTMQYFTIRHGPARRLNHERIVVEHLGQMHEPYSSQHIRANRFDLILRKLDCSDAANAEIGLAQVSTCGVPNYFDDQRFGSVLPGQPFIARELIGGNFETALKLALAAPYAFDRSPQKREKAQLRARWGDWTGLAADLPRGHARSLVTYLVHHPTDFRGAIVRLRPELRGLYLSAYQSHLWNRILARWLETQVPADDLRSVPLRLGPVPMPTRLSPEALASLMQASVPLPSSRSKLPEDDPLRPIVDAVLAEDALTIAEMQIKGVREMFFSKGDRPAHILPARLRWSFGDDETRPGKSKLQLSFELPRGSYATLIVKRIGISVDP